MLNFYETWASLSIVVHKNKIWYKTANTKTLEVLSLLKGPLFNDMAFGCVAQLVERRSLTDELSLSCARPAAE